MDNRRYILPVSVSLIDEPAFDLNAYLHKQAVHAAEAEAGGAWDASSIAGPFTPQPDDPYPPYARIYVVTVVPRT